MKKFLFWSLFVVWFCLLGVVLSGCDSDPRPDLIPESDMAGFCKIDESGNLIVKITNVGDADAPTSVTCVQFDGGDELQLNTPAIPVGASAYIQPVFLPANCFNPDCSFMIKADCTSLIDEIDGANNSVLGNCVG